VDSCRSYNRDLTAYFPTNGEILQALFTLNNVVPEQAYTKQNGY